MTTRHKEDRLSGIIEAALNLAWANEPWLEAMAKDPDIDHNTSMEVFSAIESYICDHLARITCEEGIVAYLQDADGNENTLRVTEPDPEDGTYCVHMDNQGQAWIRIVPTN